MRFGKNAEGKLCDLSTGELVWPSTLTDEQLQAEHEMLKARGALVGWKMLINALAKQGVFDSPRSKKGRTNEEV